MKTFQTACLLLASVAAASAGELETFRYTGMCDASAAAALDGDHFVVADDERNTLLIYKRGKSESVASLDLSAYLGTAPGSESDLEGSATIGQRIYWISSHGRNKNGKLRPDRHRFFATDISSAAARPALVPVKTPYVKLLDDLVASEKLKSLRLSEASQLAPEAPGGLNIEGLAARPDGSLLIGFRSPVRNGKALLVPMSNPEAVLDGQSAILGAPILLNLGGRGIRSIELVKSAYLIVAGPVADSGTFALFRWTGRQADAPVQVKSVTFKSLRPEALFEIPAKDAVQILSDDGGVETAGIACKDKDVAAKSFRSVTMPVSR